MSVVIERCNACEKIKKSDDQVFELFFANCGHLICGQCKANLCPVCKKETTYAKLEELPDNLKLFFQDPSSMIKLYGKIIEFQNMQNGIVQKQVFQQNKKLQQENSQMQKQLKEKDKELQLLKGRCSDLEHELEKRANQLQALTQINEKMSVKKRTVAENNDFNFKVNDETKSTFFDPSQLISKPTDNKNTDKVSPYLNTRNSDQMANDSPANKLVRPNNKTNAKNKMTYDNLNYFLK